jgi:hypothetical protein
MSLGFPLGGNSAEVVGQVGNLRRVGTPPEPPIAGRQAPVANRRAGYHPAPQSEGLPFQPTAETAEPMTRFSRCVLGL